MRMNCHKGYNIAARMFTNTADDYFLALIYLPLTF
jgi:hypothetical protein